MLRDARIAAVPQDNTPKLTNKYNKSSATHLHISTSANRFGNSVFLFLTKHKHTQATKKGLLYTPPSTRLSVGAT